MLNEDFADATPREKALCRSARNAFIKLAVKLAGEVDDQDLIVSALLLAALELTAAGMPCGPEDARAEVIRLINTFEAERAH